MTVKQGKNYESVRNRGLMKRNNTIIFRRFYWFVLLIEFIYIIISSLFLVKKK